MSLRAKEMDRYIDLLRLQRTRGTKGGENTSWVSYATNVPAGVKFARGRDLLAAEKQTNEQEVVFRIRYRTDLTDNDRVSYSGKTYDVESIQEVGRREGLEILAKLRTGNDQS